VPVVEEAAAAEAAAEAAAAEAAAEEAGEEAAAEASADGSSWLAAVGKRRPSRRPLVTAATGAGVGAIEGAATVPAPAPVASRGKWPPSAVSSAYAMDGDSSTATRNGEPRMGLPAKVTASMSSCSPFLPHGVYRMP